MLYFVGFSLPIFANTTPEGQPILYCPQAVECDLINTEHCHVTNNPYEMWGYVKYDTNRLVRLIKGTYNLREVVIDRSTKKPICRYYLNDKQPAPLEVTLKELSYEKVNYINKFKAFLTESSLWVDKNSNSVCLSDNPIQCPLIEAPEITITQIGQSYNMMFYFPSGDDSGWGRDYIYMYSLSYEELHKRCGLTSACIIDIGSCDYGDRCDPMGTVSLDISTPNIVKIDNIISFHSYLIKQKEPFNTLYVPVKS